jgi:two-component system, cell cycle sensor histidine kinase and response regulator CckA
MADNPSILVVDDEPDSRSLLTGILLSEGYHVRAADSGRLALASVDAWLPELILLDIRMQGMDGLEVCRRLKVGDKSKGVPIIFITAASDVEDRVTGLAAGAVDYISKPFQREELLARVRTHLELARLRENLEKQVSDRTAELSSTVDQLRESEQRFRNMADTAPVMIWVSDTDKLRTFFNKTWLTFTGRSMEEEYGAGWSKGVHPDDLERCLTVYTSAFDGRRDFKIDYRLRRADGEYRWVLSSGIPRFAPSGAFAGYIGSTIDITDFKRIQEEALSKQKLETLVSLTRGIAHDFNNMAGAILALAELAESELAERLPPTEEIHQIKEVAMRASEIVRELMIYSGQEEAKLQPVDLSGLVEQTSGLLKSSISSRSSLHLDLGSDLPSVRGNATQIRRLVMNLVINASQAIGDRDGTILVKTSLVKGSSFSATDRCRDSEEDYIRLEVSDTGCGMTEEERGRIFDPFFTTKAGGHGLGLAVVQGIVHSHNGAINVSSTAGMGTTFEVLFRPDAADPEIAFPVPSDASAKAAAPVSGTVLLVEDEDQLRIATAAALQKKGLSVISAADGQTAVELFRAQAEQIRVVVLDLRLPGLPGQEVFRQIRAIEPTMKVMFTSAYDAKNADALSDRYTLKFLQKPYRFSDLFAELYEALSEFPRLVSANGPN